MLDLLTIITLNIISYAAVITLTAIGLNFIFGLLDHPNIAHGAFVVFGSYLAYELISRQGVSYWASLLMVPAICIPLALIGFALILPFLGKNPVITLLISLGLSLVVIEMVKMIWGLVARPLSPPREIPLYFIIGNLPYPGYRIVITILGGVVIYFIYFILNKTRFGLKVRASLENREVASISGIDVRKTQFETYVIGTALAALAGAVSGPLLMVDYALSWSFLILSFAVTVTGGVGCFKGTILASFLISAVTNIVGMYSPPAANAAVMILTFFILAKMPQGILGKGRKR